MAVGEWDQRQLCADGGCIGVIGPDGTCKVCGRAAPNWGDERNRGLIDPPDEDDDADDEDLAGDGGKYEDEDDEDDDDDEYEDGDEEDDDEDEDEDGDASEPSVAAAPRGDWTARRLCSDGGCIGVIGPDGRCKVCGCRASDTPVEPSSEPAAMDPTPATPAAATPGAAEPAAASAASAASAIQAAAAAPGEPAASDREPCTTPGCSGHIGADGRCAVCGKGAS